MLDLYYWTTPNGHKITLFLEEVGLPSFPSTLAKESSFNLSFSRFLRIIDFLRSLILIPWEVASRFLSLSQEPFCCT
jgi:glutathione S-transferase